MKLAHFPALLGIALLSVNVYANDPAPTPAPAANDYPTQARVEYVFGCMQRYGKENYDTMYGCVCTIDKLAARIPYTNYVNTVTLTMMSKVAGDAGAPFRDAPGGREAIKAFQTFQAETEQACGLKKPKPTLAAKTGTPVAPVPAQPVK